MAVAKGLLLAAINVVVVAFGIAGLANDADMVPVVTVLGGIPGLLTGASLGGLASLIDDQDRWLRRFVLGMLAILAAAMIGAFFGAPEFIAPACVPTVAAALVLERWTRRLPAPPIPVATAQSR